MKSALCAPPDSSPSSCLGWWPHFPYPRVALEATRSAWERCHQSGFLNCTHSRVHLWNDGRNSTWVLCFCRFLSRGTLSIFSRLYFFNKSFYFKETEYSHEVVRHDTERPHMLFTQFSHVEPWCISQQGYWHWYNWHISFICPQFYIYSCVCVCVYFILFNFTGLIGHVTTTTCQDNRSSSIITKISRVAFTTPFPVFSPKT